MFCELAQKECLITQNQLPADTFEQHLTGEGLKDCSEKSCKERGKTGCLLKKEV